MASMSLWQQGYVQAIEWKQPGWATTNTGPSNAVVQGQMFSSAVP
jgi:hypothetical protein